MAEKVDQKKRDIGNKARMLFIYRYLTEHTDEDHPASTNELIEQISSEYSIEVDRTTIGDDINSLINAGYDIERIRSRPNKYYYDGRVFETAELKVLVDAVSSSKFITEKSSKALIDKILTLASEHDRAELRRNITVEGRVKSDNEKGYYIVDAVNEAIENKKVISFKYADYNAAKEKIARNCGETYYVSPYALVWDGDYYYLVGWCKNRDDMRHFRLDRIMQTPMICEKEAWTAEPEGFNLSEYIRHVFRMYGSGDPVEVDLLCDRATMKSVIDQFGMDVETEQVDEMTFTAHVSVCPSPTFYRWVFSWSDKMKILGPDRVVNEYREMLRKALEHN